MAYTKMAHMGGRRSLMLEIVVDRYALVHQSILVAEAHAFGS